MKNIFRRKEKMQMIKSKTMAILIVLILTISMSASMMLTPTTNAHNTATDKTTWTIISYAYLSIAPNPIGVGQKVAVAMWVDTPLPGATVANDIRRVDYALTITAPDGKVTTQTWDTITDTTGVQSYYYTPTQVGNYTFLFSYPGQTYTWTSTTAGANTAYTGDIYTASNATQTLTVQQEPIPAPIDSYPLPTEYWTYPIEGQNNYWYTIASNWLGAPYILGAGTADPGGQQPYGSVPTSAHIMWTKTDGYGGIVGGNNTNIPGEAYYSGLSYNCRFNNPLIMQGVLYYQEAYGNSGTGGPYVAVDLKTGEKLWSINVTETGISLVPSFGYLYSMDQANQHGVLPNGLLIATTTAYSGLGTVWRAYDPMTGTLTTMNVTNIPTGSNVAGPSGEYLKYVLTNYGTSTNPNWYLAQWNSSNVFGTVSGTGVGGWYSGTENASLPSAYDWNVSVNLPGTGWSIGAANGIPLVSLGNMALMIQGTFGGHVGDMSVTITTNPGNITAISLKPGSIGSVLWSQTYQPAPGNNTRLISGWDSTNGVFIFTDKETFANWGYSSATGQNIWGPSYPPTTPSESWDYAIWNTGFCDYGNFYSCGYSGLLYCWNDLTGALKWTYGSGGEGNSTNAGFYSPYGYYPEFVEAVANGMIYLVGDDHSPTSPMYKDSLLRCINATTGAEIWTIMGWSNQMNGAMGAVASGYLTVFNPYDSQVYCYGQGPSAMTVTASPKVTTYGNNVLIEGTVTDIASGTKQKEQAARFPNGVPCVSDTSQSSWMQYVYMQKPKPTNVTGAPVSIDVIDSNGNYRNIGTATTTSAGTFSFSWTPDVSGTYQVIATFSGTNSYYPSSMQTAFNIMNAAPTDSPYPVFNLPPTEMYIEAAAAAIITAIVIVGAVILLILRKKP
jgi:hypothetical protein